MQDNSHHHIAYWSLSTEHCALNTEHWILSTEYWALSTEHWTRSNEHWARSTDYGALSTEHGARSTEHRARSTEHWALSTEHGARSTEHGALSRPVSDLIDELGDEDDGGDNAGHEADRPDHDVEGGQGHPFVAANKNVPLSVYQGWESAISRFRSLPLCSFAQNLSYYWATVSGSWQKRDREQFALFHERIVPKKRAIGSKKRWANS